MIPVLGRQRQVNLCEFKTILVYRVSSRTAMTMYRDLTKQNKQNKITTTKKKMELKDDSKSRRTSELESASMEP